MAEGGELGVRVSVSISIDTNSEKNRRKMLEVWKGGMRGDKTYVVFFP
jgi:hypothetical protein